MKRIYIVRHAKSSWSDLSLSDFERPLNGRGKRDAPLMAGKLVEHDYLPDRIISSDAKRALTTASVFYDVFIDHKDSLDLLKENSLYHAPANAYYEACFGLGEEVKSVMLFGHNPGITYLANEVSNSFIDNVPTCGVLVIDCKADNWQTVDPQNSELIDFLYPKM